MSKLQGLQRRHSFLNLMVVGIDTGYVPAAAIPPNQYDGPAERGFDGGQNVKSIEPELLGM